MEQKTEARALRINDAARDYGVGKTTLYGLIRTGALPNVKVGGRRLIPVDALEALLAPKASSN